MERLTTTISVRFVLTVAVAFALALPVLGLGANLAMAGGTCRVLEDGRLLCASGDSTSDDGFGFRSGYGGSSFSNPDGTGSVTVHGGQGFGNNDDYNEQSGCTDCGSTGGQGFRCEEWQSDQPDCVGGGSLDSPLNPR